MNLNQTGLLLLAFLFAATGSGVWVYRPRSIRHALSCLMGLSGAFWVLALYFVSVSITEREAVLWTRLVFWGPPLSFATYVFILREVSRRPGEALLTPLTLLPSILALLLLAGSFHPDVIKRVIPGPTGAQFTYGKLYPVEVIGLGLLVSMSLVLAWRIRRLVSGHERAQAIILFAGMLISSLLAGISNLILPLAGYSNYYPIGPLFFSIGLGAIYYAAAKHRLWDIEIALGPILRTKRYEVYSRVRQTVLRAENYLNLGVLSELLQQAVDSPELSLAILNEESRPTRVFGNPNPPELSTPLLTHPKQGVLTPAEMPGDLRTEMESKNIAALVRIGDPQRPRAILTFGRPCADYFFSSQDFTLLRLLAERLDLIMQIASGCREGLAEILGEQPRKQPWPDLAKAGDQDSALHKQALALDPDGLLAPSLENLPSRSVRVDRVSTEAEFVARATREPYELAVIPALGTSERSSDAILQRLTKACPDLPVLIIDGIEKTSHVSARGNSHPQVVGVHRMRSDDPIGTARMIDTCARAGRYLRGLSYLALSDGLPVAKEELFPMLLQSLSEAGDYSSLTRLFQKRLIQHNLRHSTTSIQAARKLGLSAANFSIKLKVLAISERASGKSSPPAK